MKRIISSLLIAGQITATVPAYSSDLSVEQIQSPADMGAEAITAENYEATQREQYNSVKKLSEPEIRIALELQAAQIETALEQAEAAGTEISADSKAQLKAFADGIREEASKPKVKKRLLRKLMVVPRVIAQGLGYFGFAVADLLVLPVVFAGPFVNSLIAGNSRDLQIGKHPMNVLGFAGMFATQGVSLYAVMMGLGIYFPIVMLSVVPMVGTVHLVCRGRTEGEFKSAHTEKFCENIDKNADVMEAVWGAGDNAGYAVNRFLTAPFRMIFKKKTK